VTEPSLQLWGGVERQMWWLLVEGRAGGSEVGGASGAVTGCRADVVSSAARFPPLTTSGDAKLKVQLRVLAAFVMSCGHSTSLRWLAGLRWKRFDGSTCEVDLRGGERCWRCCYRREHDLCSQVSSPWQACPRSG
jgi:hypothetical protein